MMMAVSTLLKSCAMPPASWPTACIFWLCAILTFERLLLGRLDGIDDRRLLGALAAGAVGDGVDVEADVALLVVGQHRVDRRDVGLPLLGLFERRGRRRRGRARGSTVSRRTRRSTASRSTTDENSDRNGALVRTMRPLWSTPAIAIGVELKKRVKRISDALSSAEASSPCVRLSTMVRLGPGEPSRVAGDPVHEAHRQRLAGRPSRGRDR